MGFFDKLVDVHDPLDLRGEGGQKASRQAAQLQAKSSQQALAELRRQFNTSQENIQPFMDAGLGSLDFLQQGSTPEGLDQILGQIMGTDMFGDLVDERRLGVEGMLSAGGLMRSGEAIEEGAKIPTDLALQISDMLQGRASNLATMGQNAAVGAGSQSGQFGTQASNLITGGGNALASGVLGAQQSKAQGQQNMAGIASLIASYFSSDPRLKENIEKVGDIGPLSLYQWDWKPEFKDTIIEASPTIGFLSSEVKVHYPEYVGEHNGYDAIDYTGLLEELECH